MNATKGLSVRYRPVRHTIPKAAKAPPEREMLELRSALISTAALMELGC